jgi:hypothetical protein
MSPLCAPPDAKPPGLPFPPAPCLESPAKVASECRAGERMKIARVETLQADAGWRMFSFLKVTTDDGIVGWSEFNESFGSAGLSEVIRALAPR